MKRRASRTAIVATSIGACAVIGACLFTAANSYSTVVLVERHMNRQMTDLDEKDCYIKATTSDDKLVSGYGPSSYCYSIKIGDDVLIKDGVVSKR